MHYVKRASDVFTMNGLTLCPDISVETTPVATLTTSDNAKVIAPSAHVISGTRTARAAAARGKQQAGIIIHSGSGGPSSRLYFAELNNFLYAVASRFFGIRSTVTVTATNVLTGIKLLHINQTALSEITIYRYDATVDRQYLLYSHDDVQYGKHNEFLRAQLHAVAVPLPDL